MEYVGKPALKDYLKDAALRVVSGGPLYFICLGLFIILFLAGIISGIYSIFIEGSRHAYGTSREIPLAMLIATYTFFVVTSTGLCLVSSIGHIFGVRNFIPISKRAVYLSVITILSGFLVIGLELENPFRLAIYLFVSPNISSNIWWMGVLYSFEIVFLVFELFFMMRGNHKASAAAGFLGIIFGVAAISNLGGVFATLNWRDYWYGPYLPLFLPASAVLMGCAAVIFFTVIAGGIKAEILDESMKNSLQSVVKLAILMLGIVILFTVWRMVMLTVGSAESLKVFDALVHGSYAFKFWGLEVCGGMIVPLVLLILSKGRRTGILFIAAALMIFSVFFTRLNMVVVGQIVPLYWELGVREFSGLHAYSATWKEIMVVLGGAGFCLTGFLLGEKIFNGFGDVNSHRNNMVKSETSESEL